MKCLLHMLFPFYGDLGACTKDFWKLDSHTPAVPSSLQEFAPHFSQWLTCYYILFNHFHYLNR